MTHSLALALASWSPTPTPWPGWGPCASLLPELWTWSTPFPGWLKSLAHCGGCSAGSRGAEAPWEVEEWGQVSRGRRRRKACRERGGCREGRMLDSQHPEGRDCILFIFLSPGPTTVRGLLYGRCKYMASFKTQLKHQRFPEAFLGSSLCPHHTTTGLPKPLEPLFVLPRQLCVRVNCSCVSHPHSGIGS